ncbi:MAG: hypothetical protein CMJ31_09045 [Phycisphaerae bacterium]|nr:hypothetical protein [Phycisphaerae bacterium]
MVQRNNVMAGLFLISGLVLAVLVAFWIDDFGETLLSDRSDYIIRFDIRDGVAGVDEGSAVTLGGRRIGTVDKISLIAQGDDPAPRFIDVTVTVDADYTLYTDARPIVVGSLLGTLATIDIPHPGGVSEPGAYERLAEGGTLQGGAGAGMLGQLGLNRDDLRAIVAEAQSFLDNANGIVGAFRPEAEPAAADLGAAIAAIRRTADRIDERSASYTADIDTFMERLTAASDRFGPITKQAESLLDDGSALVSNLSRGVDDVRSIVADNRDSINGAIDNASAFLEKLNGEFASSARDIFDNANRASSELEDATRRANALLRTETPTIRRTLANVRLVSDRATVFFEEVSAAPWRLLNRPGSKELEEQLVYDAARQYADAVSRLRGASASLEAALQAATRDDASEVDSETLELMHEDLMASFRHYERSETALLDAFEKRFPATEDAKPRRRR